MWNNENALWIYGQCGTGQVSASGSLRYRERNEHIRIGHKDEIGLRML